MLARLFLIVALAVQFPATVAAQYVVTHPSVVRLYPDGAPGSQSRRNEPEQAQDYWVKNIHDPTLTVYRADPAHASGASVIIFPGGGHSLLVFANEGAKGAEVLNRMGITAFVLKYRLAREPGSTYTIEGDAAGDASRSVKWVRAHAAQYGLDPRRIGVMGFSAGGELASLIANYPTEYAKAPRDALSNVSARPDFQILVFPGPLAVKSAIRPDAPPAFLVAGSRDECCGPPTVALYELLTNAKVSAELHMYAKAGHAFNIDETNRISVLHWPDRLFEWMSDSGLLDDRSKRGR